MSGIRLNLEDPIKDGVTRVRFAPQSNDLLISSWDSSIRLYDVDKNELRLEAQTEAAVLDCCFQNHSTAFSVASDGSVFRHDLQTGTCNDVGQHDDSATCIEYSDETSQVITTGWDKKMLSWEPRSFKVPRSSVGFTSHAESISLCRFELLVGTGSLVHKYDLRKLGGAVQAEELPMSISIRCVRAMAVWEGFAVGSDDGRVTLQTNLYEMGYTFRCAPKSKNRKYHHVTVNDIAFSRVPGVFVTGDYEGHVIAWDAKCQKRLLELPRYPNSVASLSYNHTGELLAIASSYAYQEANELEDHPQIFIQEMRFASAGSSARK
ncbi:mitotic checkpoint protein BUB3.3-like isoform X1 [Silene latifolia]|uniref:mitotic checkpoint protein BUB3.3-like isoform X1 n=1 Tax=Silene latifolia TaxID=37657 RepID=UPI003D775387